MKFSCKRERFAEAYAAAVAFAATRSHVPVIQNVKLEVNGRDKSGVLMATDNDVSVRILVQDLEVEAAGAAVLPARFGNWVRESSDEQLRVERGGSALTVRGDRSVVKLQDINPDEHPGVPATVAESYLNVAGPLLRAMIQRTVFATDPDSSRFALGGVLFEFAGGQLTAVATDGRRLAKMEGPAALVGDAWPSDSIVVPARSCQLVERSLANEHGTVQLCPGRNAVVIRTPGVEISTRLVEGRFPRWREVLPKVAGYDSISVVAGQLSASLRQAAIVTDKDSKGVTFAFSEGQLELSCQTANVGQTRVELPVGYSGPAKSLIIDHGFLHQFLRVLEPAASVAYSFGTGDQPTIAETEDGYQYVVMPLAKN